MTMMTSWAEVAIVEEEHRVEEMEEAEGEGSGTMLAGAISSGVMNEMRKRP
jgi:hypothetical protein